MTFTGGCVCGSVRYCVQGKPLRVSACHCKDCQRRTGSAFGIGCYFPKQAVKITQGKMKNFARKSDAGNFVKIRFCPFCGSSLMWQIKALPQAIGIAGGTFDNTCWILPELHVWAKSAQNWVILPEDVEVLQESNLR